MASILKVENLVHIYGAGTPFERRALDNINIEVKRGEFLGLIGHTGSGKSTLIQHLNGLLKADGGRVLFEGKDIWEDKKELQSIRFKVGLVFQYPEYQLFEETVYKDIAFGPKNMKLSEGEIDERVREAASFAGIEEELLEKSPFELSGGQKRRAAIAGVMAMRPEVLILDEPTAGLDPLGRDEILSRIRDYHKKSGATIILVTHSMEDVAENCNRILVMDESTVYLTGTPEEVFSHAAELRAVGLSVPQITKVFIRLQELGLGVDSSVFTVGQAIEKLKQLKHP
ncbi:MAG: energy-coupling factor transporter ATPase [Oscillospiraceae bacterium]|nr:energy-coupling factor transporter ATPase [Oscillospiraceae bacterium]